jgi:lysine-N-methylase
MAKPPRRVIALRYMTRFQCLGGDCEDTCCRTWTVSIDQSHYHKLKRLMKPERALFDATFALNPPAERTRDAYATIQMSKADNHCPLLSDDKTCSLHRRYGEPVLPDICSFYPRFLNEVGPRLELSGSMSCPEVARQALLHTDGVELVEVEPELLGRAMSSHSVLPADVPLVDEVRGTMLMLLGRNEYPMASRLFFLACLAKQAAAPLDAGDLERLIVATGSSVEPAVLDRLHEQLRAHELPSTPLCLALLNQLARLWGAAQPSLRDEIDRVLDSYVAEGTVAKDGNQVTLRADFFASYARRRAALSPALAEHLESVIHNYAASYCMRELHLRKKSFEAHVLELLLRVSLLRFLILSEPSVLSDRTRLDARVVSLVYQVSRAIDHRAAVSDAILEGMHELLPSLDAIAGLVLI